MDNAIFRFPKPINEPVKAYAPGSSEKASLKKALAQISSEEWDIPLVIGGKACGSWPCALGPWPAWARW